VNFGWFHLVMRSLENDDIKAIYDPSIRELGTGLYVPENTAGLGANAFVMTKVHFPAWKHCSIVVHEAVHASQDLRGFPLSRVLAEGAAHVAQNVYHRLACGKRVTDTNSLANNIHIEADKLAQQVVDNTKDHFDISDSVDLERAILAVPWYQIPNYEFDGVPGG